ncbi:MAG: NBR1-Ig-like domain-containing protein, partial [Anaerolineales bacterium]
TVEPGRQYEFSVPMVAPTNKTGEIKGTWRLSDVDGNFFGDGVYVLINVGAAATAAPTATPTATP